MTPQLLLTREEARHLALVAQRLEGRPDGVAMGERQRLHATIAALGCVQLDTISVVSRSHQTVLWSRLGGYDPAELAALHFPDGDLIEYWAHAAALAPTTSFPYFRDMMDRFRDPVRSPSAKWGEENATIIAEVLDAIGRRGPLASRDFERPEGPRPAAWSWWGGKPANQALDLLWSRGDLAIVKRVGFQRVYDLVERVIPEEILEHRPSPEDRRRFFADRALRALGIATPQWMADYFRGGMKYVSPQQAAGELRELTRLGAAIPVAVEDGAGPHWLDGALEPALARFRAGAERPVRTTLLSPFDSLVWNRDRALRLFDFDYRLESYTPAHKRLYGYYTLPILHRGRVIGRLDPVYRRKERVLTIRAIHLERGVRATKKMAAEIAAALRSFIAFLGGGTIVCLCDPDRPIEAAVSASCLAR